MTVGNGFDLADRARAGALDLAVAKMAVPPADAVVLWRDTVVWAAAPDFDLAAEDLPLAVGAFVFVGMFVLVAEGAGRGLAAARRLCRRAGPRPDA